MIIKLRKSQIELLVGIIENDYLTARFEDQTTPGTIEPSWYKRVEKLGDSIAAQTGMEIDFPELD